MYNFIFLYQLDFDCLETTIIICVVDGLCVCVCVCACLFTPLWEFDDKRVVYESNSCKREFDDERVACESNSCKRDFDDEKDVFESNSCMR